LQNAGVFFTVEGFATEPDTALARVPVGSTVEVNGICLMQIAADGRMRSLDMLLPTAKDIRILQKPNWLTPKRLRGGLAILLAVLVVALSWIVMVHKKNLALKVLIKEKAEAQQELQESHDLLESRVVERTTQLKFEMTARKEAELRFKATLAERTRLAQELHDTLEQSLAGIGFQLDTAAILIEKDPAAGNHHVGLARNLMRQSQLELRRSVWDLRSRELEQFDFATAMRVNARQMTEGTNLRVEMETTGDIRALSEVTEENLLRISREALTNVLKHAGASEVKISLEFDESDVVLRITDNGSGFTPENCPGQPEGHFGLVGMTERAKRLDGRLLVTSAPGSGTCLEVRVPMRRANGTTAQATTEIREPT
jgi:signal transduction histidine kinase